MVKAAPRKRLIDRVTARTVDEAEAAASVLLAIAAAHWIGAASVYWAAFAGYMVMRGHAAETLVRGLLRIAGTGAGGLLASSGCEPRDVRRSLGGSRLPPGSRGLVQPRPRALEI